MRDEAVAKDHARVVSAHLEPGEAPVLGLPCRRMIWAMKWPYFVCVTDRRIIVVRSALWRRPAGIAWIDRLGDSEVLGSLRMEPDSAGVMGDLLGIPDVAGGLDVVYRRTDGKQFVLEFGPDCVDEAERFVALIRSRQMPER